MPRHPEADPHFYSSLPGPGPSLQALRRPAAGPSASVCSRLLWLLKIKTGTMSSATSNTHLVEWSKSNSAVSIDKHCQWSIWENIVLQKLSSILNPNAQYSNLDSEQYISSAMGPELMINFCPRDYPGIYAVKNSKSEHFNGHIFIKILFASSCIYCGCMLQCYKLKDARCRWNSVMHWVLMHRPQNLNC